MRDLKPLCRRRFLCQGAAIAGLAACGTAPKDDEASAAAAITAFMGSGWRHQRLPGKRDTQYAVLGQGPSQALCADANASASMLRRAVQIAPADLGQVRFSWQVPALIEGADLRDRNAEDSPVRLMLAFDGDRSKLSARDLMLSELAQAVTGEPMPYATLMYVWDNHEPLETVIPGNRTRRIQKIVVDSGATQTRVWRLHQRRIVEDFRRAFGEDPGTLTAVALMTDTDNTHSKIRALYGAVRLTGPGGQAQ